MYGYVLPNKSELKIKHYYLYQSFYCGICKAIKKNYGELPRCTLSYDITFFALLLTMIKTEYTLSKKNCVLKFRRNFIAEGQYIDRAADLNILFAYYKLLDNKKDENNLLSEVARMLLKRAWKKAVKRCPVQQEIISKMYEDLAKLEELKCWSVSVAAEPFAKMMEKLVEVEVNQFDDYESEQKEKIIRLAYLLGKWIYIIDATDDFEKDVKEDNYNPFRYIDEDYKSAAEVALFSILTELGEIFDNLKDKNENIAYIVENIIFAGMLDKTDIILGKRSCENCDESIRSSWFKRRCNFTRN